MRSIMPKKKKRTDIRSHPEYKKVMKEFKKDNLWHTSGYIVEDPKQAKAIAKNTAKRAKNGKTER